MVEFVYVITFGEMCEGSNINGMYHGTEDGLARALKHAAEVIPRLPFKMEPIKLDEDDQKYFAARWEGGCDQLEIQKVYFD